MGKRTITVGVLPLATFLYALYQLQSAKIQNFQSLCVHVEILWKIWNPQTKLGARASHGFVVGGASTSAIFTPEVGINYPPRRPIIRRQRYLNRHLLPTAAADLATPLRRFWFVWTPDMGRRQPFGRACETFLGGPEIPQSLAFIKMHLWMFPRHYGRGFYVYSLPLSTLIISM